MVGKAPLKAVVSTRQCSESEQTTVLCHGQTEGIPELNPPALSEPGQTEQPNVVGTSAAMRVALLKTRGT